jgi:ribosomal protein S18 acetylase RimI-like enzyme
MLFKSLEHLSVTEITRLFNQAFADYFIKIDLSAAYMQSKLYSENVCLDKSLGVFVDDKPVAFMLHAIRNNVAYNAGTGVIPEFRGQHLTVKMYEHLISKFKEEGISEIRLEAIDKNIQAIKSYAKVGFIKQRKLPCFKGKIEKTKLADSIQFLPVERPNFELLESFWDWSPTWQSSTATLLKLPDYAVYAAFMKKKLVAYIYANSKLGRVAQFAVHPEFRRKGIATALFQNFASISNEEVSVFNTDGNHKETHLLLEKIGLKHTLSQVEMKLNLNTK